MAIPAADRRQALSAAGQELALAALAAGQPVRLRVTTGSMRPLLRPGDEITVAPAAPGDVRPGDLLVRAAGGGPWVVHRLNAVRDGLFITQGDCALAADRPWPAGELAGRVTAAWRAGRPLRLKRWWARPAGRLLAAAGRARGVLRRLVARKQAIGADVPGTSEVPGT